MGFRSVFSKRSGEQLLIRTNNYMRNRRLSLNTVLGLVIVVFVCLGSCLVVFTYLEINRRAETTFGLPASNLDLLQRLSYSSQLLLQADQLVQPVDPLGDPDPFEIPLGEPPPLIASRLEATGLIHDAEAFITYLKYSGLDTTLQAGKYTLSPALTPLELADVLQDATPSEVTFSVLPGWRIEEIAASIPTSGLEFSEEDFLKASFSPADNLSTLGELAGSSSIEGFLYPGSYRIPRVTSADELIQILVEQFSSQLTPEMLDGFQRQGLNIFEAVILASIVERESVLSDEMPLIASVFLNRLAIGMPLEADSTVQYAVGYNPTQNTWWTNPLSVGDLQFDSPYNTYLYPGLTPGPIANPDARALRAVAFPAQTPYYYFRATCDNSGRHDFSETFEEHLNKACP